MLDIRKDYPRSDMPSLAGNLEKVLQDVSVETKLLEEDPINPDKIRRDMIDQMLGLKERAKARAEAAKLMVAVATKSASDDTLGAQAMADEELQSNDRLLEVSGDDSVNNLWQNPSPMFVAKIAIEGRRKSLVYEIERDMTLGSWSLSHISGWGKQGPIPRARQRDPIMPLANNWQ